MNLLAFYTAVGFQWFISQHPRVLEGWGRGYEYCNNKIVGGNWGQEQRHTGKKTSLGVLHTFNIGV